MAFQRYANDKITFGNGTSKKYWNGPMVDNSLFADIEKKLDRKKLRETLKGGE